MLENNRLIINNELSSRFYFNKHGAVREYFPCIYYSICRYGIFKTWTPLLILFEQKQKGSLFSTLIAVLF